MGLRRSLQGMLCSLQEQRFVAKKLLAEAEGLDVAGTLTGLLKYGGSLQYHKIVIFFVSSGGLKRDPSFGEPLRVLGFRLALLISHADACSYAVTAPKFIVHAVVTRKLQNPGHGHWDQIFKVISLDHQGPSGLPNSRRCFKSLSSCDWGGNS